MILTGARVALGPEEAARLDLEIRDATTVALGPPRGSRRKAINLSGCLILPGLINAHDHLEFNLFPRLGRGPYPNAAAWARDIYQPRRSPIREHLRVPKAVRLAWGGLKNLLSGVTTVCHHNPGSPALYRSNFPVRVARRFGWAHSLEFSDDVAARFHRTPAGWPFILHLAEATNGEGRREIFLLDKMGALERRTVLVHGVALDARGLRLARSRGASLVWCPSSNLFTLGRTLSSETLRGGVPVALGTDSALTAQGDLLDELRVARRESGLKSSELYHMVTDQAARMLRLEGGASADLLVVADRGQTPAETLLQLAESGPEMVMIGGRIRLIRRALAAALPISVRRRLRSLNLEGRGEFLVDADVPKLYRLAAQALGPEIRLAGKRVWL